MREEGSRWPVTAISILVGAALGVLIGAFFIDAVGLNLGFAIVIGAALGVIIGATVDHLRTRGD